MWSRRHRDLGRARNQVACRLHAVLCELVPGGVPEEITAGQAASILAASHASRRGGAGPPGARRRAPEDLRGIDAQIRETKKKLLPQSGQPGPRLPRCSGSARSSPPRSSATSATCPGSPTGITSPPTTAPPRSRCPPAAGRSTGCPCAATGGINHAIHMAAITQIRYRHSPGRAYYDKKLAEGKTGKEALRCLKRQISDAIYARLQADARPRRSRAGKGPGRATGERL